MSIGMHIRYQENLKKEPGYVPIAPSLSFPETWGRVSLQLGLQWVPLFNTYLVFESPENLSAVVDELSRLYEYLANPKELDISDALCRDIRSRILFLIGAIKEATENWKDVKYVSFG